MNAEQNPVIASVTTHLPWAGWCQADFAQTSASQLSNTNVLALNTADGNSPDDDLVDEVHVDGALPLHQPDPHRRADLAMRRR